MLIICRTWTVVHVLHATKMVTKTGGWRRSSSLKAGVLAVIKRLSWWFWRRFYEERWSESFTGRKERLLQKWERGRNGGCFRCGVGQLVVGLATLARPKGNVNYLQNVNSGSRSARNQNGCRDRRLTEEHSLKAGVLAVIKRLSWWF
jgi:hypothetical protein